jgi:hypothetical protein
MVFNDASFNNISIISLRSFLLVEETGVPEKTTDLPQVTDEVLLTISCPIFPSILIAKNLLIGSFKNRSIDNLETQKKYISMKNSQFFDYLLYAKSK